MIIQKLKMKTKSELQKYITILSVTSVVVYETDKNNQINEVIDYEKKNGTIKTIIIVR